MLSRFTTGFALLLAATHTVAQTSTSCDPTKKTCPDDTGLASSTYTHDFTTSGADDDAWKVTAGDVKYTSSGAEFTVSKSGDHPTIQSNWYLLFGRVSFFLKAAPGTGIVSSAILQSDDLDEIDWEWLGGANYDGKVQSNYFGKGNTTSYNRAVWTPVSTTQTTTHNYTISWTSSSTTWLIDNVAIRTLNYADAVGGKNYPQTPMNVRIGIWAGGDPANDPGTIEWSGGETDYNAGPFTMVLEKIEVVNANPGKSYSYGDLTGDYESIIIDGAEGSVKGGSHGSSQSSSPAGSSSSVAPSSSSVGAGSSKAAATTTGFSTGTVKGVSATGSASASASTGATEQRAQAATGDAPGLSLGLWHYGGVGVMVLLAAWW